MGQITTTQNLVAIKEVRHAGQSRPSQYEMSPIHNFWDNIVKTLKLLLGFKNS